MPGPRGALPPVALRAGRVAPVPVPAVTHGGIATDLLRNLLGDDALPRRLLDAGIPPGAVTVIDDLNVVMIASTAHLSPPPP